MIRITKPMPGPDILAVGRGKAAREALLALEEQQGAIDPEQFSFDSSIYGCAAVKQALSQAQADKCCFCEAKIKHIQYGDVEHFRPKAGTCQNTDAPLIKPGYYWLAYSWDNLYLCCQLCNQRHKRNAFPLNDPAKRARCSSDDLTQEDPLFVDPGKDEPRDHIMFEEERAKAKPGSKKGKTTVEALDLNRNELIEVRLQHLALVKSMVTVLGALATEAALSDETLAAIATAKSQLRFAMAQHYPFSAMVSDYIAAAGGL